jgi:hypothetical protein
MDEQSPGCRQGGVNNSVVAASVSGASTVCSYPLTLWKQLYALGMLKHLKWIFLKGYAMLRDNSALYGFWGR